jgi:hypothetical protein
MTEFHKMWVGKGACAVPTVSVIRCVVVGTLSLCPPYGFRGYDDLC